LERLPFLPSLPPLVFSLQPTSFPRFSVYDLGDLLLGIFFLSPFWAGSQRKQAPPLFEGRLHVILSLSFTVLSDKNALERSTCGFQPVFFFVFSSRTLALFPPLPPIVRLRAFPFLERPSLRRIFVFGPQKKPVLLPLLRQGFPFFFPSTFCSLALQRALERAPSP